jgi:hypothetical protein
MVLNRNEIRERLAQSAGATIVGVLQVDDAGQVTAADVDALDFLGQEPEQILGKTMPALTAAGVRHVQQGAFVGLLGTGGGQEPPVMVPDWEVFTQLLATSRSLGEAAATVAEYAPQFLPESQGALLIPRGDQLHVLAQWPHGVASFDAYQMGLNDLVAVRLGRALSARLDARIAWRGPQPVAMSPCFLAGRLVAVVVAAGPLVPDVDSVESFARRVGAHLLRFTEPGNG